MVYNILIENTDDHSKNHAFLRNPETGRYTLSPAFDLVPHMQQEHFQAMRISPGSREDNFSAAIEACGSFGLNQDEAVEAWRRVARGVSGWKDFFAGVGVSGADIKAICTEAGMFAIRDDRTRVKMLDFTRAIDKVTVVDAELEGEGSQMCA